MSRFSLVAVVAALLACTLAPAAATGPALPTTTLVPLGKEDEYVAITLSAAARARYNVPADAPALFLPIDETTRLDLAARSRAAAASDEDAQAAAMQTLGTPAGPYGNPSPDGCASPLASLTYAGSNTTGAWCGRDCTASGICDDPPAPAFGACMFGYGTLQFCGALCDTANTPDDCGGIGSTCRLLDPSWGTVGFCAY